MGIYGVQKASDLRYFIIFMSHTGMVLFPIKCGKSIPVFCCCSFTRVAVFGVYIFLQNCCNESIKLNLMECRRSLYGGIVS